MKLTRPLINVLTSFLIQGVDAQTAAALAHIPQTQFEKWMAAGEKAQMRGSGRGGGLRRVLWVEVTDSIAEVELKRVKYLESAAAEGKWRAALILLQRQYPERWGVDGAPKPKKDHGALRKALRANLGVDSE